MAKTVVGLFDDFGEAQAVVRDLEAAGFDRNQINLVANETASGYNAGTADTHTGAGGHVAHGAKGLVGGAVEGGVIGGLTGLAAGLVALMIPAIGPVVAIGPLAAALSGAGIGAVGGGILGGLIGLGIPKEEAGLYAEGIRRGGTLVTVQTSDDRMQEALDIFNRHNPVDIEQRASHYQQSGYTGYNENVPAYTADQIRSERARYTPPTPVTSPAAATSAAPALTEPDQSVAVGDRVVVPVVEEQLSVGKREVSRGGARVHTTVTERPIEENVTLREEHVNVERHPVDRPLTDADRAAFQERTFVVNERAEEAVVSKQAHVVEEVVIDKEATQREQTVRDTVRRTDVAVEELDQDDIVAPDTTTRTTR